MRNTSALAALLTIASAYPPGAPAWGGLGHRTMGAIADRLLGPAARARGREGLHRAWDNELVGQALKAGRHRRVPADIGALAVEAGRLTGRAGPGTPDGWALESNELARTVAYHYPAFVCGTVPSQI